MKSPAYPASIRVGTRASGAARWLWTGLGLVALVAVVALLLRPLTPVDETRYLSVAWEMWRTGDWILPHLNGVAYDHKPPLLFWLIELGWAVFGVNAWWPRLLTALSAMVAAVGVARLAQTLWPDQHGIAGLAALMLLGTWFVAFLVGAVMFDLLLLAFVAWGWRMLWLALREDRWRHWVGLGLLAGLALLTKGPVAALYLLSPLPTLKRWRKASTATSPWRVVVAMSLALALPGSWILLLLAAGHGDQLGHLLIGQTTERMTGVIGHPRPWYWYLPLLPLLALPWTLWPPLWRAWRRPAAWSGECGTHFALGALATMLIALSAVAGKQAHYLIPLLAMSAPLMARALLERPRTQPHGDQLGIALAMLMPLPLMVLAVQTVALPLPIWFDASKLAGTLVLIPLPVALVLWPHADVITSTHRVALAGVVFCAVILATGFVMARPGYDLAMTAHSVADYQKQRRPVAWVGHYEGELNFLGRLDQPLEVLEVGQIDDWRMMHPEGVLVLRDKRLGGLQGAPVARMQPYRSGWLLIIEASAITEVPSARHQLSTTAP